MFYSSFILQMTFQESSVGYVMCPIFPTLSWRKYFLTSADNFPLSLCHCTSFSCCHILFFLNTAAQILLTMSLLKILFKGRQFRVPLVIHLHILNNLFNTCNCILTGSNHAIIGAKSERWWSGGMSALYGTTGGRWSQFLPLHMWISGLCCAVAFSINEYGIFNSLGDQIEQ